MTCRTQKNTKQWSIPMAAPLRAGLQRRTRGLVARGPAALAHELVERRQTYAPVFILATPVRKTTGTNRGTLVGYCFPPRKRARRQRDARSQNLRGCIFGQAHALTALESVRVAGPAPGRTLHQKSGSTGAEGQLANTKESSESGRGLSNAGTTPIQRATQHAPHPQANWTPS